MPPLDSDPAAPDPPPIQTAPAEDLPCVLRVEEIPFVLPVRSDMVAPPRGGLGYALGLCLMLVIMEVVIAIPFAVAGVVFNVWKEQWFHFGLQAITSVAAVFVVARHADFGDVRRTVALRGCRPIQLILALILAPALMPLATAAANLVTRGLGWEAEVAARPLLFERFDEFYAEVARLSWPLAILCGCLAPAVSEELFFRGVLGRRLLARYGTVVGVLLTTLLFALAHVDPTRVAATFLLGLALHGVYLATRSLLPGMALHAFYNFLVIAATKFGTTDGWDVLGQLASPAAYGLLLAVSLCTVAVVGRAFWKARTRWLRPDGSEWSPGYVSAESPPPAAAATPQSSGPGTGPIALIGVCYLGLGLAFGLAAEQPLEWLIRRHLERGNERWLAGDLDGALASYGEALRLKPDDIYALGNRGSVYVARGDPANALADLDRALTLGAVQADWMKGRGWAYWSLGRMDEALADYTRTLQMRPADAETRRDRGLLFRLRGNDCLRRQDYAAAIREFDAALADDPNDPYAVGNRGMAFTRQRDFTRGLADLDRAIERIPDEAEWYIYRAGARLGLGETDRALTEVATALRLRPGDSFALHIRGRIHMRREDWDAALTALHEAKKAGADTADVRADCGRALFRLARYADAESELAEALKRQPDHDGATYDMVWLRAACPDDAQRNGEEALKLASRLCKATNWKEANPLSALAAAEAECGHFDEAVRRQEEAIRLSNPGDLEFHEWALELYHAGQPYRFGDDD